MACFYSFSYRSVTYTASSKTFRAFSVTVMTAESSFSELKIIYYKQFGHHHGTRDRPDGQLRAKVGPCALDDLAQCMALVPFKLVRRSATDLYIYRGESL